MKNWPLPFFIFSQHITGLLNPFCVIFDSKKGKNKYLPGIIIYKHNSLIYIWLNNCPHANLTLDIIEGRVQAKDNDLLCANHGAKFNPITGECIKGPCKNSYLKSFPFKIKNDYVLAG